MKNFRILFGIALSILPLLLSAQTKRTLYGVVTNEKEEILIGASVFWKATPKIGTITDETGHFLIVRPEKNATLVVSYVGHTPAEVEILTTEDSVWVEISGILELKETTVAAHGFDNATSLLQTRNVESINRKELRKAPCCNLSESFETTGAVDVAYTNAITGVKEIQMLGLRGLYSQFLVENRPTMGGIATPFAFEYIPGTWLDGIVLAKGASTVKNGFAGITGQINADIVKPSTDKPLFVNAFTSSEGRGELNVHLNKKGKTTSNGLLLHSNVTRNTWDMNNDNFYDGQIKHQLNAMYRLIHDSKIGCAQFNIQALTDQRRSGQINAIDGVPGLFEVRQGNERVEAWAKYGKEGVGGKPYNEIGNMASMSWHRTNSVFGNNIYAATQQSVFVQSLYQTIFGTTDHKFLVAPNLQYDNFEEKVNEGDYNRRDIVPGMMAEYTFSRPNLHMDIPDLVIVAGARVDWHNRFGWLFTPRMSAKYNFTEKSIVRMSAGRGYRTPNVIAENISMLASNRTIQIAPNLGNEEAWNYGINYTQEFTVAKRTASFSLDAYRTDFVKQVLMDVEKDYSKIYFYNLEGKSYSNSVLAVLQYNPVKGLDVKVAFKINDVRATFDDGRLKTIPLIAKQRGLVTLDYNTPNKKWMFNTSVHIVGQQRLPDNTQLPHDLVHHFPEKTPTYALVNAQITRKWKKTEVYIGSENLTNYQQHHAIISAENPNSPFFNAAQIWAPMMGAIVSAGVRFSPSGVNE